jgi:hypothetical protein
MVRLDQAKSQDVAGQAISPAFHTEIDFAQFIRVWLTAGGDKIRTPAQDISY